MSVACIVRGVLLGLLAAGCTVDGPGRTPDGAGSGPARATPVEAAIHTDRAVHRIELRITGLGLDVILPGDLNRGDDLSRPRGETDLPGRPREGQSHPQHVPDVTFPPYHVAHQTLPSHLARASYPPAHVPGVTSPTHLAPHLAGKSWPAR